MKRCGDESRGQTKGVQVGEPEGWAFTTCVTLSKTFHFSKAFSFFVSKGWGRILSHGILGRSRCDDILVYCLARVGMHKELK